MNTTQLQTQAKEHEARRAGLLQQYAVKILARNTMLKARAPLLAALNDAQKVRRGARYNMSNDAIFTAELRYQAARSTIEAFDKQHADVSVAQLERDKHVLYYFDQTNS